MTEPLVHIKYHYRCKRCGEETYSGELKQTSCSTEADEAIELQLNGNMSLHGCKDGGFGIRELIGVARGNLLWEGNDK